MFVSLAGKFASQIDVTKDSETVDGKSILGVLTLLAEQGTELTIRATGPDASEALAALRELVMSGFGEEPGTEARRNAT
jgi:phosphocarrier protein